MKFAPHIPKTVFVLGLVSFFTDLSSEMIYPLLPLFLTSVLGVTVLELGVIEGIAESSSAIFKLFSGVATDRFRRRKPLILAGYGISGLVRPMIGLAYSWTAVLALRFIDRLGKGVRTSPRDALIADATDPAIRGRAFGFHRAMDHAGAVAGPLVASCLLLIPGIGLRDIFLLAVIPGIISIIVLFYGIKEPVSPDIATESKKHPTFSDWRALGSRYYWVLAAIILFTLGNASDAFILKRLMDLGLSPAMVAGLWSLHHVIKMAANIFGGRFADKRGKQTSLISGWILYSAVYCAFAFVEDTQTAILLFLFYGLYYGLVEPAEKAIVADLVPARLRGTAFGLFHMSIGLGALPASVIFGLIWREYGVKQAFLTGAGLSLAAAALLLCSIRWNPIIKKTLKI